MNPDHASLDRALDTTNPVVATPPVLDFDELLRRCMNQREFALKLLNKVRAKLPDQIDELRELGAAGRGDEAALLAHELKGGTSSVGAKRIAAALTRVEQAARASLVEQLPPLIEDVRLQWLDLSEHLAGFMTD